MEPTTTSTPNRVLAVFAHPDDETFVTGGLLARLAASGADVRALSATAGETGTDDPVAWPPARLAAHRRIELALAMETLGVAGTEILGVPDGRCADLPRDRGIDLVAERIDAHAADLVVTFGPDGWTGHDDHRAVSRWATEAAARAGVAAVHAVVPPSLPVDVLDALGRAGAFYGDHPHLGTAPHDREHVLTGDALTMKLAALACHQSQTPQLAAAIGQRRYRQLVAHEAYRPVDAVAAAQLDAVLAPDRLPERVA